VTLKTPLAMQAAGGDSTISYSALDLRVLASALYRDEGLVLSGSTGVDSLKVTQRAAGANFTVDIAAGFAVIAGDDVSEQGSYVVRSTATENRTIPAPPGSGTRTHRVVAQIKDKLHNGVYTTYEWTLDVLEDTGSGTPAVPASAIGLARVAVASGQSSVTNANITDDRVYATPLWGRPIRIGSDAERPANPPNGYVHWRTDKHCHETVDSGTWADLPRAGGGGSAWTAYTPALTASSVNPTLGTGSIVNGSWYRVGRLVTVNANLVLGTGATAGTGTYRVSLPVTAKTLTGGYHMGSAFGNDTSANNGVDGISRIGATGGWDKAEMMLDNVLVTNAAPFTWAATDIISITITYEAAT
jgi:hypothetical protein